MFGSAYQRFGFAFFIGCISSLIAFGLDDEDMKTFAYPYAYIQIFKKQ
jgi:hypothetical protein